MALKGSGLSVDDFFGSLVDSINDQLGHSDVATDIIDFIDNVIDREGWGVKEVHRRQYLLFKTFYGLELDEEDIALLEAWYELDRTSINPEFYQPGIPFQSLCIEAGRRASKCITLDTLIPTSQGFIEAKELRLDPTVEWQSVDFNVAIPGGVTSKADRRFYNGFAEVKRIKTFNGYSIGATKNHRIKILDKSGLIRWEYMDNLKVGDVVCIERNSNLWAEHYQEVSSYFEKAKRDSPLVRLQSGISPKLFDENYGYLLGLLCGDGSWTTANLVLTGLKSDLEVYLPFIKKTFVGADLDYQYAINKSVPSLRIGSVVNKRFFENLGYCSQYRDSKRVPWIIMKSPKSVIASFLSGLFDTDGCFTIRNSVELSSSSRKLIEEVQTLLLNFGIVSRISTSVIKGKEYYKVYTVGLKSRTIFAREVGFKLPRKQEKLLNSLQKKKEGGSLEAIPDQINWLKRILNCLPLNSRGEHLRSEVTTKLCGREKSKLPYRTEFKKIVGNVLKPSSGEELTYPRVKKLLEWVALHSSDIPFDREAIQHFSDLVEKDYYFDEITSIENSKEETLDLGVPEHHCYTANGFTSHNSWSASVIVAYEFYKLCMLKSPQKKYNIATSTPIAIYCIATSATQTKKTIFGQAKALLEYIPPLKRLIDQKKLIIGEEEVKFPEKLLHIYSGNSNSASQVGSSVILLVMDEVARFDEGGTEDGESKAIELWSNIGISGTTFGVDAKKVAISSAWREGDAIQFLYNKAKTSNGWLGYRLRSWDLNPVHAGRDNPIIQGEYDLDPRKAALEFEGVRFNRAYSFFNDQEVERAFTGSSVLRVNVLPPAGDNLVRLELKDIRRFTQSSVMHLDPAFVRDAYAIAFGHREVRSGEKVAVIDGLLAWEPDIGQQVGITNVYQAIYQIHGSRPQSKITSDHYNPETVQRLKMTGLNASIITFSQTKQLEIYDFARKLLHENRLILPKDSPWSNKLKEELFGIQLIKNRKIDHRRDGCFSAETRIPLLDGTRPTIAELEGKEVWVYSCKPNGTFVPGKARGRKTKEVSYLLDIVLDTGAIVRCTPEHLFMTRTGDYIQAKDISPGITRLMPINFLWPVNGGYEKVSGIKQPVATHWMALGIESPGEGNVVHHLNGVKTDNRPENLKVINRRDHVSHHTHEKHQQGAEYREKLSKGTIDFNKKPSTRQMRSESMKARSKEWYVERARKTTNFNQEALFSEVKKALAEGASNAFQAGKCTGYSRNLVIRLLNDEGYKSWEEFEAAHPDLKFSEGDRFGQNSNNKKTDVTIEQLRALVDSGVTSGKIVSNRLSISYKGLLKLVQEHGYLHWSDFLLKGRGTNHKVRDIIHVTLDSPVPVYDLEVDEWDNFALAAGIIVHNSKDICDAVAVVAWHLMSDLSAAIPGTAIRTESREARMNQGDANSDIAFGGAGRELATQIRTSYKGWGTSRNDGGSWSEDDYF